MTFLLAVVDEVNSGARISGSHAFQEVIFGTVGELSDRLAVGANASDRNVFGAPGLADEAETRLPATDEDVFACTGSRLDAEFAGGRFQLQAGLLNGCPVVELLASKRSARPGINLSRTLCGSTLILCDMDRSLGSPASFRVVILGLRSSVSKVRITD